jgi:ribosomal protein S27AE
MRKKKYKKLVEELRSEVLSLKEELQPLKERQILVERYETSLKLSKRQETATKECPNCKANTYFLQIANEWRCYSCNYPRTQGSIDTWIGKS